MSKLDSTPVRDRNSCIPSPKGKGGTHELRSRSFTPRARIVSVERVTAGGALPPSRRQPEDDRGLGAAAPYLARPELHLAHLRARVEAGAAVLVARRERAGPRLLDAGMISMKKIFVDAVIRQDHGPRRRGDPSIRIVEGFSSGSIRSHSERRRGQSHRCKVWLYGRHFVERPRSRDLKFGSPDPANQRRSPVSGTGFPPDPGRTSALAGFGELTSVPAAPTITAAVTFGAITMPAAIRGPYVIAAPLVPVVVLAPVGHAGSIETAGPRPISISAPSSAEAGHREPEGHQQRHQRHDNGRLLHHLEHGASPPLRRGLSVHQHQRAVVAGEPCRAADHQTRPGQQVIEAQETDGQAQAHGKQADADSGQDGVERDHPAIRAWRPLWLNVGHGRGRQARDPAPAPRPGPAGPQGTVREGLSAAARRGPSFERISAFYFPISLSLWALPSLAHLTRPRLADRARLSRHPRRQPIREPSA